MFSSHFKLIITSLSPEEKSCSYSTETADSLILYNNLKEDLLKIHCERTKWQELFDEKFNHLINEYFINDCICLNHKTQDMKLCNLNVENSLSQKAMCEQKKLRELFFEHLMSYCFDYFFNIKRVIYDNAQFCHKYSLVSVILGINNRFHPKSTFTKENGIDFKFLVTLKSINHTFLFFHNRLEHMVAKHTGYSAENVRACLYFNNTFIFEFNDDNKILNMYRIITYYLFCYGPGLLFPSQSFSIPNIQYFENNDIEFYDNIVIVFEKHFKPYFKINMESDSIHRIYKSSGVFSKSKIHISEIEKCCLPDKSDILRSLCEVHLQIITNIKKKYLKSMMWAPLSMKNYFDYAIEKSAFLCSSRNQWDLI
ncbi:hypothetical protein CDIK_1317 [Cucumispora dikerogammari]|nr:hypothetical protein CDIK_1317 [Cucumispora dikerogammari]